jgi:dephospho-CoA kinase
MMPPKRIVIGLTGGIATGKSAVLNELRRRGIPAISADTLAHQCLHHGHSTYRRIVRHFGAEILNDKKAIDRKRLGQIIFASSVKRRWLEKQIHPWVIQQLRLFIRKHPGLTALDIPLLFEAHLENLVDVTVVVSCSFATQVRRVMRRNGLSRSFALQRIRSQMPLSLKRKRADYVISNNGSLKDLKRLVGRLVTHIRRKS